MIPIRKGDRGPAVEDVQRRLLALGAVLGPTGVDGVFLGATYAAVVAFQRRQDLDEDGVVGPVTWSALVDATFTLGDRLIYLRSPYLHGADVRTLQSALNALGFACGEVDGIFGAFCERGVREFQANTGLAADGIVGPDTVRALTNLRHVWADKPSDAPAALRAAPARNAAVLASFPVAIASRGTAPGLADRIVNLAAASEPKALVTRSEGHDAPGLVVELVTEAPTGVPAVLVGDGGPALSRRMAAALASGDCPPPRVAVVVDDADAGERATQSVAVALLDGLCLGLASAGRPVLP